MAGSGYIKGVVDTELAVDGSLLAKESGGNLATIAARLLSAGAATAADILASILARLPVLGPQLSANSLSTVPATDAVYDVTGDIATETTLAARLPVIGPQVAASSLSVTPDSGNAAWAATGLAKEATMAAMVWMTLNGTPGTPLATGAVAVQTYTADGAIAVGKLVLFQFSTNPAHLCVGAHGAVAATANHLSFPKDQVFGLIMPAACDSISVLQDGAAGTFRYIVLP